MNRCNFAEGKGAEKWPYAPHMFPLTVSTYPILLRAMNKDGAQKQSRGHIGKVKLASRSALMLHKWEQHLVLLRGTMEA